MWVRFVVQGKSQAETYRWFPPDHTDEDLRAAAEDWAAGTSQGQLNDHYRYGFTRVKKLPPGVKKDLIAKYEDQLDDARSMLRVLDETDVLVDRRRKKA